ncbi:MULTISPECIES: SEC-C metal-binding domain-containing protein [Paenibacillus]|uniref:SEC-C metal-binding domain-containing protein n=1 Tax=Paenibacillus TaxID=44249 RepID=UPI002FE3B63B
MPAPSAQISPNLISLLTDRPLSEIPVSPSASHLPGALAKLINRNRKKFEAYSEPNKQTLICGHCGRQGQYDLGQILFDIEQQGRDVEESITTDSAAHDGDMFKYFQATGYFRCKHCNGAGNWTVKDPLFLMVYLLRMKADPMEEQPNFRRGKTVLHDGTSFQWVTDAEEHLLDLLADPDRKQDGYLWNRLGNLYIQGKRPELAAAAFEKSLQADPAQAESHFSLGLLLDQIRENEKAAYHYKKHLICAKYDRRMDILDLRQMMAAALRGLTGIHLRTAGGIEIMPTKEDIAVLDPYGETAAGFGLAEDQGGILPEHLEMDFDLIPDQLESFYPVAEMYLGDRREEIPEKHRTFDVMITKTRKEAEAQPESRPAASPAKSGRTVIVTVKSEEQAAKISRICEKYDLECIIGIEFFEDLSDLRKALTEKLSPSNIYEPCPCNSGKKFKFCCAAKLKRFDLDEF